MPNKLTEIAPFKGLLIHPSPSKYPLIKCLINSVGTCFSVGNFNIKDFLGTTPLSIKFC